MRIFVSIEVAELPVLLIGWRREVEGHAAGALLAKVGACLKFLVPLHLRPFAGLPIQPSAQAVAEVIKLGVLWKV